MQQHQPKAPAPMTPEQKNNALTALINGVAAAPEPLVDQDRWMDLIASPKTDKAALQEQLRLARQKLAKSKTALKDRLGLVRKAMRDQGLDAFIVPKADEHQGEYIAAQAERLAWVSGFTGSAGSACLLQNQAALFVDGRYTLQAADEVDADDFIIRHITDAPMADWLSDVLKPGDVLGIDPWLTTISEHRRLQALCNSIGAALKLVESNPVDQAWEDQPPRPLAPVMPLDENFITRPALEKLSMMAEALGDAALDAFVIAQPESIAWLLNVRGGDVPFTPLPLSFAIIHADGHCDWVVDPGKITPATREKMKPLSVEFVAPLGFDELLQSLGQAKARVGLSQSLTPVQIHDILQKAGATLSDQPDPSLQFKACKTPAELGGMVRAHQRDGAALCTFLKWLDDKAQTGLISEMQAADHLQQCRAKNDYFQGLSFPTISGAGPNGAIVHYRVTAESNRQLEEGSLYLVDSGAQYLDGTTDVTRTVAIGKPTEDMRRCFTLVLKGHIALAGAVFPKGTTGSQLDILARQALWQAGLDYDHGTGHGVGTFLSVHEGPQRISKIGNSVALEPGMVISNEPGYYKTNGFGIRIENLVAVTDREAPAGAERPLLGFQTLTLAPIDQRLIDPDLLDKSEIQWLNSYHQRVFDTLADKVSDDVRDWLQGATSAMTEGTPLPLVENIL